MRFKRIYVRGKPLLVSCDYWKLNGTRWPVDYPTAQSIASDWGCELPTPEIVDAIWKQADIKLSPFPLTPVNTGDPDFYNGGMQREKYFDLHDTLIEGQLRNYNKEGKLIAGHKKDIVVREKPGKVAIYGWHDLNGKPIQPYSHAHGEYYKDYSHGLRLIRWE